MIFSEPPPGGRRLPFVVGEHLQYTVYFGPFHVGSGEMRLIGRDSARGARAWKASFTTSGGLGKLSVHDTSTSWFDSVTFNTLHFVQHVHDPGYHALRDIQIFPDRQLFKQNDDREMPSVSNPMDDVSLVYFVRTLPLEPGQCYVLHRYFRPDGNPVVLHVLRREKNLRLQAGTFNAIVVRPEITTHGVFSQNGRAELWLSDDSARVVLQLTTHLSFGSLNLYLTHIGAMP